jgi:hypothetical protein
MTDERMTVSEDTGIDRRGRPDQADDASTEAPAL